MRNIAIVKSLQMLLSFIFFIVTSVSLEISEYGLFVSLIAVTLVIDSVLSIKCHEIVHSFPSHVNREDFVQRQLFIITIANIFVQFLIITIIQYTSLLPDIYILAMIFSIFNNIRYFSISHRFLVSKGFNLALLQLCDSLARTVSLMVVIIIQIELSAEIMLIIYVFSALPGLCIALVGSHRLNFQKIYEVRIQHNVLKKTFYSILNSGLKSGINSIDIIFLNNLYSLEIIGVYDRFKRIFGVVLGFGDTLSNYYLSTLKEKLENKLPIKLYIAKKNIMFVCIYLLYCILMILALRNYETLAADINNYSNVLYAVILFNLISILFIWWTKYFSLIYDARLSVIQSVITLIYYTVIMQWVDDMFGYFLLTVTSIAFIRGLIWVYQVHRYEKSLTVHI